MDRHLRMLALPAVSLFSLFGFLTTLRAQPGANSEVTYIDLRNISLGSESYSVSNFDLHRDTATFHLSSGTVCFTALVNGKVTGAVFSGEGNLALVPPLKPNARAYAC